MAPSERKTGASSRRPGTPEGSRRLLIGRNILYWTHHILTLTVFYLQHHAHTLRTILRQAAWRHSRHHPLGINFFSCAQMACRTPTQAHFSRPIRLTFPSLIDLYVTKEQALCRVQGRRIGFSRSFLQKRVRGRIFHTRHCEFHLQSSPLPSRNYQEILNDSSYEEKQKSIWGKFIVPTFRP